MPTYLLHGFRWPRPLIRIHVILQNLDDVAAEWLCSPTSTNSLLENFAELFPASMPHLPNLRFVEQYDPNDTSSVSLSQPFAYVADVVQEVKLGIEVDEVRGRGVGQDQWGALMEVRDRLAPDEKVGWYVVVCGDEERWAPKEELARGGLGMAMGVAPPQLGHVGQGNGKAKAHDGLGIAAPTKEYKTRDQDWRRDQGLRELREQIGYRTDSDASEYSSGDKITRHTTSTPATPAKLGNPGNPGTGKATGTPPAQRTPDTSLEPDTGSPSSAKMGTMRRWLSKRKSQKSMKELAKAQAKDAPPPVPNSPAATPGKSPRPGTVQNGKLPVR